MEFHLPLYISEHTLQLSREIEACCRQVSSPSLTKLNASSEKLKCELIASFLSMEHKRVGNQTIKKIMSDTHRRKSESQQEVSNALRVCAHFKKWDPLSLTDFKKAHRLLMSGIDSDCGVWRVNQVVVKEGNKITHTPPKARKVPQLMRQLFRDIKQRNDLSWVIRACVFHYGVMYIHPFANGNGRIGRVWQHLLILKQSPIFQRVQISAIIRNNELSYYRALDKSDAQQDGSIFVEFCLKKILVALKKMNVKL